MGEREKKGSRKSVGPIAKIMDPVFVCMCSAVALAIGSSVMLRVMSGGASAARATDYDTRGDMIFPALPKLAGEVSTRPSSTSPAVSGSSHVK